MAADFKPGDKVWIDNRGGRVASGTYAGVTIALAEHFPPGWWAVDVEGVRLPDGTSYLYAHEKILSRRDDPPQRQDPKREQLVRWDECPWHPATTPAEAVLRFVRREFKEALEQHIHGVDA